MDYFDVVKTRRSVRKFSAKKIPEDVIKRALEAALLAPNSSNMQPWEFYWVKTPEKREALIKACLSQQAARSSSDMIVAVSRIDTWKRNRKMMLEKIDENPKSPAILRKYYAKLIPLMYRSDPFGFWAVVKWILFTSMGLFRPVTRGPLGRAELFEMVTKSTALACENLMLAIVAQGYACCPMEGFDQRRVKKILGLGCGSHIVMVIGMGEGLPQGIYGAQLRFDPKHFVFEV